MIEPYYEDELTKLYLGACEDVLPHLPTVDLVITSPPYNMGNSTGGGIAGAGTSGLWTAANRGGLGDGYADHDDNMPLGEYEAWQKSVLSALWERLSDRGAIYYNHKPRPRAGLLWTPLACNPDLPVRQIVIWSRRSGFNFSPTHYVPTHEWIVIFAKPDFKLKSKGASGIGDVWEILPDAGNDHPAPFPIGLPARIIETTPPGIVLDPFAGSGTTLRAAMDAGVQSIGIEKSERYAEMAVKRLAQQSFFG